MSNTQAAAQLPLALLSDPAKRTYKRREPETTLLHRIVRDHLEEFLEHARDTYAKPIPRYVERAFRGYLECGLLRHGFTRVRCPSCRHEFLVAFSCKCRSTCPSCATRRMVATAAHVADKVLPREAVRQWVLSVPREIRGLLAAKANVLSAVIRIFGRVVSGWYARVAREAGIESPKTGGLSFPQRFGGSLNLHVHLHDVVIDGVFAKTEDGGVRFVPVRAPSQAEILQVAAETGRKVIAWLKRHGYIGHDSEQAEPREQTAIEACMQVGLSAGTYQRIVERGDPNAAIDRDDARFDHRSRSPWSAEADGFSVNAGVRMRAEDGAGTERLLRYCARPALSLERLSQLANGLIAYRTKYPLRGGRTHRIMTPTEFLARLAALIPPPRHPLVRYFGVLAPASKWRRWVVPAHGTSRCEHASPMSTSLPEQTSPKDASSAAKLTQVDPPPDEERKGRARSSTYIDWATLMRRGLRIDVLDCPECHQRMRPVAVIEQQEAIEKILTHLELPLRPEELEDGSVGYDVTGESILTASVWWEKESAGQGRGPPSHWDGVDAPSPAE